MHSHVSIRPDDIAHVPRRFDRPIYMDPRVNIQTLHTLRLSVGTGLATCPTSVRIHGPTVRRSGMRRLLDPARAAAGDSLWGAGPEPPLPPPTRYLPFFSHMHLVGTALGSPRLSGLPQGMALDSYERDMVLTAGPSPASS